MNDLFGAPDGAPLTMQYEALGAQAWLLRGMALSDAPSLLACISELVLQAPWHTLMTPGGRPMSAWLSSCGPLGWHSDIHGYRYTRHDPLSRKPWPPMPAVFLALAQRAAQTAGFADFMPDACLLNRYVPGARMGLHQDREERNLLAPIVSVSLGMPAQFLWGGLQRRDPVTRVTLFHGDVVVWGGVDRLRYHGIAPLQALAHPVLGLQRINMTFRKAG